MSLIITMIDQNASLSTWKKFSVEKGLPPITRGQSTLRSGTTGFGMSYKDPRKYAKVIMPALSHPDAVELVALEWEALPSALRIELGSLANDCQSYSGTVKKNITRLDKQLGGKLLRETQGSGVKISERVEKHGEDKATRRSKTISGSEAGARRKYGIL